MSDRADLVASGTATELTNAALFFGYASRLEVSGSLTLGDGAQMVSDGSASQLLIDSGATVSYPASAAADSSTISVPVLNSGTISSTQGTLIISTLSNLNANGALSGGTYNALGGIIQLPGDVTSNAAKITLGASPSAFVDPSSGNALATLTANSGLLDLQRSLTVSGALANSGTLTVEKGTLVSPP